MTPDWRVYRTDELLARLRPAVSYRTLGVAGVEATSIVEELDRRFWAQSDQIRELEDRIAKLEERVAEMSEGGW